MENSFEFDDKIIVARGDAVARFKNGRHWRQSSKDRVKWSIHTIHDMF